MSPDPFPHERVWSGHETTITTHQTGDYRHIHVLPKSRFHHQCIDECMERTSLRPYHVVSVPSTGVSNVCEAKNVPLQVRMHA